MRTLCLAVCLTALLLLAACVPYDLTRLLPPITTPTPPLPTPAPGESILPFETIARDAIAPYAELEPTLIVITRLREIQQLAGRLPPSVLDSLQALDFESYFAVVVLHGRRPHAGYSVTVQRITQQGDQVTVYAELWDTGPGKSRLTVETQPYHVVRVRRGEGPIQASHLVVLRRQG